MMLDIDHFKSVNDTYGHAAGDAVLCQISERLRDNLRAFDLIARVGGEEFLIAMPNTNAEQAEFAADRLRRLVNGEPFTIAKGKPRLPVTLSIGVAVGGNNAQLEGAEDTIRNRADEALYAAKTAGRNQVFLADNAA